MPKSAKFIIAAKCAPEDEALSHVEEAGLKAVELFTNAGLLKDIKKIKKVCAQHKLRYAFHVPTAGFEPEALAELASGISAEAVVFHNIYWDDEWARIAKKFKGIPAKVCVENTYSVHEPVKFMRRYGMGRCLDLEHIQLECAGIYREAFKPFIREASHIHMTGYYHGSELWHTHIHYSPERSMDMLDLLEESNYKGFVVSEARHEQHTLDEFRNLQEFFDKWKNNDREK